MLESTRHCVFSSYWKQLTKDPKKEEKGKQKQKENQKKKPVRHYTGCLVAGSCISSFCESLSKYMAKTLSGYIK